MLIFLGVENLVDVSHLQPSMLIFAMLIPHPTFSMLIFLGVENLVDVSHLRPSMLIFWMLIPHPTKIKSFFILKSLIFLKRLLVP
jgi:hypothetical protein